MPQQQQQRVCTPMVVVAFVGCQVAVMVMHAGRHDAHVAREGKRWHRNDFAAPTCPCRRSARRRGDSGAQDTRSGARRRAPCGATGAPSSGAIMTQTADSTQQKAQLSAAEGIVQGLRRRGRRS